MAVYSLGPTVNGISIAFAVLTFFVLCARLFARTYVLGTMGIDDYLIILACIFAWALLGAAMSAVRNGLGTHIDDFDMSRMRPYSIAVYLTALFYPLCLGFIKTSVLAFYTRLGDPLLKKMAYVMFVVIVCQTVSFSLSALLQCIPIHKAWDTTIPGKCIKINDFYLANAAINILTDILTYTLPIKVILNLHVPNKQKVALGFVLCLGLLACVSSIIRITYVSKMISSEDATYVIAPSLYWSVIETNVAILAASMPSFKAIASRFLPQILSDYSIKKKSGPWSSNNNNYARKYANRFSRMDSENTVTLDTFKDVDNGDQHGLITTEIHPDQTSASSNEGIVVPQGQILHETQINVEVTQDGSSYGHSR